MPAGRYDEVRHHYDVERSLAERLRVSTRAERLNLYRELYDELFRQVPEHPLLTLDADARRRVVASQLGFLRPLARPDGTFLEIGAGDCQLSIAMAAHVRQVFAVDVSAEITSTAVFPDNCQLIISKGCDIPVPPGSVHLAFSDQLMEHLHPDDALEQLREIYRALRPGGIYVLFTPNRLSGPHDVSKYFDAQATGFHLKEYTSVELSRLLRQVGFRRVMVPVQRPGHTALMSARPVCAVERLVGHAPGALRQRILTRTPLRKALGRIAAIK